MSINLKNIMSFENDACSNGVCSIIDPTITNNKVCNTSNKVLHTPESSIFNDNYFRTGFPITPTITLVENPFTPINIWNETPLLNQNALVTINDNSSFLTPNKVVTSVGNNFNSPNFNPLGQLNITNVQWMNFYE